MSVLEPLVAAAERRARADARIVPLRELRDDVRRMPPAPRFAAALRYGDRLGIVAEVKRASPSEGTFAGVATGSAAAVELAAAYAAAGARAVSILTEPTRFAGSDEDLERIARRVMLPALRKDFITTPYGVWQARALGAGAVLLIVRTLTDERLGELLAAADEAGIDALVEVHDARELDRALREDATLIGVNARDLDTLQVDVPGALRLLAAARDCGATLVAESGLSAPADLRAAAEAGAHAVLVGTSLLRSADPAAALRDLVAAAPRREAPAPVPPMPARAAVKVCGIRSEAAVRAARVADADLAGFIIAPGSPRAISAERAGELARGLGGRVRPVLVTREPDEATLRAALAASGIGTVQLAGFDAPPPWTRDLDAEVIGVVHDPPTARAALLAAEAWLRAAASRVLLEAAPPAQGGGAGAGAPLDIARRVGRHVPVGIAGGLRPENVAATVRDARPAFVDAASGLERNGTTDPGRLGRFVREARRDPTGADRVDRHGRFGRFGGRYVPETLMPALAELETAWTEARRDPAFRAEADLLARDFIGRPTPVFEVPPGALRAGRGIGPRLFLKREDLA
ncbi:MAG TPA: hypothetical protein VFG79_06640, partial [Solirubrobacter sp.]|nr:hypothetical protein [Solirubrobacter sp.]